MNQQYAQTIVSAISARSGNVALFHTATGYRLRSAERMKICELADPDLIGVYNQNVTPEKILYDWH